YLQFNGSDTLSPFLTEMVVKWAVKGPSYRDARDRFYDLLGYQAMSHEKIRQEVLKIEPKSVEDKTKHPKDVDARSEEHTSELQSRFDLVCRLLLEKKKKTITRNNKTMR